MSVRGVNKLSIIGAGAVGSSLAYASLIRGVARHVVLHDINAAKVRAEALDLAHGSQFMPQARVEGSEDPEITRGSDVVVITAGAKQKPGETRMDLAASTVNLMKKVIPPLVERSPEAIFLMVTNPVDVTTYAALKISGLPRNQLFGSGTVLDSSRLRYLVAEACEVAVVNAAYEVIAGKGATNYAIGLAATRIIESVLRDEHRVLPVSSLVEDWYGIKDVCLSVPTIVDRQGAGHTLRQPLTDGELGCMHESADAIRYTLNSLGF